MCIRRRKKITCRTYKLSTTTLSGIAGKANFAKFLVFTMCIVQKVILPLFVIRTLHRLSCLRERPPDLLAGINVIPSLSAFQRTIERHNRAARKIWTPFSYQTVSNTILMSMRFRDYFMRMFFTYVHVYCPMHRAQDIFEDMYVCSYYVCCCITYSDK